MTTGEPESSIAWSDLAEPPAESSFLGPIAKIPTMRPGAEAGWAGRVVAERYRLARPLGRGGQGDVWEAEDTLTGGHVALKLLGRAEGARAARARREVAALRLLRLPGIVTLLDEGVDNDRPFVVMDRIVGAPFPGCPVPCTWEALAPPLFAVLTTLSQVHAAGVLHRDLKPANILVDAAGRPVVLDFGLSSFSRVAPDALTEAGTVLGTPAFMAPEQVRGEPATARADLYAVGAMAYYALAGQIPHGDREQPAFLLARATRPPEPLQALVPALPAGVASTLSDLLAPNPDERPHSAAEVLARLQGGRRETAQALPWLGSEDPVHALIRAAESGRSIDVVGPRGSGRTRCLEEAAAILRRRGRRVLWLPPRPAPFAALEPLVGALGDFASSHLDAVRAHVEARVTAVLREGAVVIADDIERIDAGSSAVLDRGKVCGTVLRARILEDPASASDRGAIVLKPFDETALLPLFAGSDRLFHIREDAARVLWVRTEGLPARIAHEVLAWTRAGLARWDGERVAMDREAIERIQAHLHLTPPIASSADAWARLPSRLRDLLCWIALATPHAGVDLLARAIREPPWRIEAELAELLACSAAYRAEDGSAYARLAPDVDAWWGAERRCDAHRRLAEVLPHGAPGRLTHVTIAGSRAVEIALEARAAAVQLYAEGRADRAVAVLEEGLRALRTEAGGDTALEEDLLAEQLAIALSDWTPRAVDRVLYALVRAGSKTPAIARMVIVAQAAIAVSTDPQRALQMLDSLPAEGPTALEIRRQALRMVAARSAPEQTEERVLAEVSAWASATGDREALARLDGWTGRLRYRQGRFDEAAELHLRSAGALQSALDRVAARINAASALLEAFRHEEARSVAAQALAEVRPLRSPYLEARAEWATRAAEVRLGRARRPELELVEAVASLGVRPMEALVSLTEAVPAFRGGDVGTAIALCDRAARLWTQTRTSPEMVVLARALAVACGAPVTEDEARALWQRATACVVPGVGLQALALLARGRTEAREPAAREALVRGIPLECHDRPMDVLSAKEALEELERGK